MRTFLAYHLPALLWVIFIFILSSIPRLTPPSVGLHISDKFYHFIEFGIFALFLIRSFMKLSWPGREGSAILIAASLGVLWGILDEVHQTFVPGREVSVLDGVADALGVVTVSAAFWWWIKKSRRKQILE